MASDRTMRPWVPRFLLALGLLVPLLAQAGPPDSIATSDMFGKDLPGQQAEQSLRHILEVPTAETRWRGLPQFGRELFRVPDPRLAPAEDGPVGPDYVLGPGDNLLVFISSLADTSFALTLDREGKVFLPRVGTTFLWGLSFAKAEELIKARLATVLRNARIQVTMGRVRALDLVL